MGFCTGARAAFTAIVEAFARDDVATLRPLLDDATFSSFEGAIRGRAERKEKAETTLIGFEASDIAAAELHDSLASVTVRFVSEQINVVRNADGQIAEAHSISAGLDYPGIGPEHSWLKEIGRVRYDSVTDVEALAAFQLLCRTEGIIPALEPAHAIAAVEREAKKMDRDQIILANLCGRGDKDIFTVAEALGTKI
jgi:tryptophan synthase beta subunit